MNSNIIVGTLSSLVTAILGIIFTTYWNAPSTEAPVSLTVQGYTISGVALERLVENRIERAAKPGQKIDLSGGIRPRELIIAKYSIKNTSKTIVGNLNIEIKGAEFYYVDAPSGAVVGSSPGPSIYRLAPNEIIEVHLLSYGTFWTFSNTFSTISNMLVSVDNRIVEPVFVRQTDSFASPVQDLSVKFPALSMVLLFLGGAVAVIFPISGLFYLFMISSLERFAKRVTPRDIARYSLAYEQLKVDDPLRASIVDIEKKKLAQHYSFSPATE